ncbi:MAG: hypothetical protein NZ879_03680 [Archaeoglobaceae archaeon]|nr:hypothetical protein [Archaeoglobaceae archaeon]MDW8118066.1 hypothetical protein [Archaeoglobaceae archaeon]
MDRKVVLKGILEKVYRIEAGFESEANFKAFLEVMDEEQKRVLFQLMSDSEKHKVMIEELAKKLGIELTKKVEEFSFSDKRFFNEIYKLETSAKVIYEQIIQKFGDLLGEEVEKLKELVRDEERHARLVEKFIDKTLRIL